MRRHLPRVAAAAVAALTGMIGLAAPASATVHSFDTEAVSAELVGLFRERDIPHQGNPSLCPGSSTFAGSIDDSTTTDNITGTLTWTGDSIDLFTLTDVFQEVYTGTSSGNAARTRDRSPPGVAYRIGPEVLLRPSAENTSSVSVQSRTNFSADHRSTAATKSGSFAVKYAAPRSTRRPCNSGDAIRPPGARPRSISSAEMPCSRRTRAHTAPEMPAPTTATREDTTPT